MTCFKEIDSITSGKFTKHSIQNFLKSVGMQDPEIHEWIFRRFCPYDDKYVDVNDFKRVFDIMGEGIFSEGFNNTPSSFGRITQRQVENEPKIQGKSSGLKSHRSSSTNAANARKRGQSAAGLPRDTHKQKVLNMFITSGGQAGANGVTSGGFGSKPLFATLAEEKIHSEFINKGKRKKVLIKEFLHDSKLLTKNHAKKRLLYEIEMLKTIQKIAELIRELSKVQNDLAMYDDFNIMHLFKHFDKSGKAVIVLSDFESGLYDIGILPHRNDICLLMKTFDEKSKARLTYDEFCKMILPKDETFQSMMTQRINRAKVRPGEFEMSLKQLISKDTLGAIIRLFDALLTFSVSLEALKQRLMYDVGVELTMAFALIPKSQPNALAVRDLDKLYKQRNISITGRDITEFIKIWDLDEDGKLSYHEFVRSLMPVMNVKYF